MLTGRLVRPRTSSSSHVAPVLLYARALQSAACLLQACWLTYSMHLVAKAPHSTVRDNHLQVLISVFIRMWHACTSGLSTVALLRVLVGSRDIFAHEATS